MDKKTEILRNVLLDLVTIYKHILFGKKAVKQKQEVWQMIYKKLISSRLINPNRDWKGIRQQWYNLTAQARRTREQFLLGRIYDIPEFDKKLLTVSGIPLTSEEDPTSQAVDRLNTENQREVNSLPSNKDNLEVVEHKFPQEEDVKSKELSDKMEIDFLSRKVNEQRFKLQQCELLKRKCEIYNMKNKNEKEEFMKLL